MHDFKDLNARLIHGKLGYMEYLGDDVKLCKVFDFNPFMPGCLLDKSRLDLRYF